MTVLWESSLESGAELVLSSGGVKGRYVASRASSEGRWFQRFMTGCHARMRDVVDQDRAYTTPVIHTLLEMYK